MTVTKRSLTALWLMLAAACGGAGSGLGELEPMPETELTLHVENQNFYDAAIYAVAPSVPERRIGSVPGNTERTFTFRWTWIEVQIHVRLVGATRFTTETMPVEPGDELELIITPDADRVGVLRRP